MQRRKRHLRLKSIVIDIGGFQQIFDFNMDESIMCSPKEKEEKINKIKLMIDDKKRNNSGSTDINHLSNSDLNLAPQVGQNGIVNNNTVNVQTNADNGIIYDLSHYDSKEQKNDSFNSPGSDISEENKCKSVVLLDSSNILDESINSGNSYSFLDDYHYFIDNTDDQIDDFRDNENSEFFKNYLF